MQKVVLVALMVWMVAGGARADTPAALVTFTVDNINKAFYEQAFPVFRKYEVRATLYPQTAPIGTLEWDMDWSEIRAMHRAGWEIGAHSYSHEVRLSQATQPILDLELGAPAARIFREVGEYPKTFATPFGDFNDAVLEQVRYYYDAHLMGWGNNGYNDMRGVDHFRVNRVEIMPMDTPAYTCGMMEKAARDKQWLVFMMHQVVEKIENRTLVEYKITLDQLDAALRCASQLEKDGKLKVVTAAEALDMVPHLPTN